MEKINGSRSMNLDVYARANVFTNLSRCFIDKHECQNAEVVTRIEAMPNGRENEDCHVWGDPELRRHPLVAHSRRKETL